MVFYHAARGAMNLKTSPDSPYQLYQPFAPAGDQPAAIAKLVEGIARRPGVTRPCWA